MKTLLTITLASVVFISDPLYAAEDAPVSNAATPASRTVTVSDATITTINTKLGFQTVVRFEGQEIVQVGGGGGNDWSAGWTAGDNTVSIVGSVPAGHTNFNVTLKNGALVSLVATEVGKTNVQPDGIVRIAIAGSQGEKDPPKYVPVSEVAACNGHVKDLEAQIAGMVPRPTVPPVAPVPIAPDTGATSPTVVEDYRFNKEQAKELHINRIYHNDQFTYIEASPSELLNVYAIVDKKKQHWVQSEYDPSTHLYRVVGVLDKGVLKVGKTEFKFERRVS